MKIHGKFLIGNLQVDSVVDGRRVHEKHKDLRMHVNGIEEGVLAA